MDSDHKTDRSEELRLSILDNAFDFLLSAAESVRRNSEPRALKDAVLQVASGVELLLKARLASEHWSLIFSNVDQANKERLAKGDFTSVDFSNTITRLEEIVEIPIDQRFSTHLKDLRNLRNRLTHFTANLNLAQARSLVVKSMVFCIDFCEQQKMIVPALEDKVGQIHINLVDSWQFMKARMDEITESVELKYRWVCPECWQEALVLKPDVVECRFCRHKTSPRELAAENADGDVVQNCPVCGDESTFAFVSTHPDLPFWMCFSCGEGGLEYGRCRGCNRVIELDEQFSLCEACLTLTNEQSYKDFRGGTSTIFEGLLP